MTNESNTPTKKKTEPTLVNTNRMKAISVYTPRIIQEKTQNLDSLIELIAARSTLNEGTVGNVLKELVAVMLYHLQNGQAIKIDDLGTFTPKIDLNGNFSITHRLSLKLKNEMARKNWFQGDIKNKDMIGKSLDDLIARWNQEHPDDQI